MYVFCIELETNKQFFAYVAFSKWLIKRKRRLLRVTS